MAIEVGHTAAKAENTKRAKCPDLVSRFRFKPVAIETSGVFAPAIKKHGLRDWKTDFRETWR